MKYLHILLLIFFSALLSLGQLQRITLSPITSLYVHDIVLVIWSSLLVITNIKKVFSLIFKLLGSFFANKLAILLFLIVVMGWTGAVVHDNFPLWTLLYSLRLLVYFGWAWLVYNLKPFSKNWLSLCFISSGLLISLFGLLQYFLLPDVRFLSILGWDDHFYRLISTQLDPNFTGLLIVIVLFWIWSLPFKFWQWLIHGLEKKQLKLIQKISTSVASGVLLISIGLTFSRSTLLALFTGLITYVVLHFSEEIKSKKMSISQIMPIMVVISIVSLTLLAAPKPSGEGVRLWRTSTAYSRIVNLSNWIYSLEQYHLFIGRGLFVPPPQELLAPTGVAADHANLPDNFFVLLLSSFGIPGVAIWILMLGRALPTIRFDDATTAIVIAIMTHSLFNNSLLQAFVLFFLMGKIIENNWRNQLVEKVKEVSVPTIPTIEKKP